MPCCHPDLPEVPSPVFSVGGNSRPGVCWGFLPVGQGEQSPQVLPTSGAKKAHFAEVKYFNQGNKWDLQSTSHLCDHWVLWLFIYIYFVLNKILSSIKNVMNTHVCKSPWNTCTPMCTEDMNWVALLPENDTSLHLAVSQVALVGKPFSLKNLFVCQDLLCLT